MVLCVGVFRENLGYYHYVHVFRIPELDVTGIERIAFHLFFYTVSSPILEGMGWNLLR